MSLVANVWHLALTYVNKDCIVDVGSKKMKIIDNSLIEIITMRCPYFSLLCYPTYCDFIEYVLYILRYKPLR